MVKTEYGAPVTPYFDDSVVIDINPGNKDTSHELLRGLYERKISSDGQTMCLNEGYYFMLVPPRKLAMHKLEIFTPI